MVSPIPLPYMAFIFIHQQTRTGRPPAPSYPLFPLRHHQRGVVTLTRRKLARTRAHTYLHTPLPPTSPL